MIKNILITGGAGFIGSHITDKFIDNDYNVVIVDNLCVPNSGYKNTKAKYININILSDEFESIFKKYKFDYCIHLAAQASVSGATKNPYYDAEVNILGSIKVIELCKKYNIKKVIVSSSAAVYGNPEYLPVDEDHSTKVLSNYGLSKLTMEKYLELSGQDYIIFRFANVYGERQTSYGEAGVISIFDKAMREDHQIRIDDDGEQTRDFVYVDDIAEACFNVLNSSIKNEIINVSTGAGTSINQLFNIMAEIYSYNKKPVYSEQRKGDIKHSILNNNKYVALFHPKKFELIENGLKNLHKSNRDMEVKCPN